MLGEERCNTLSFFSQNDGMWLNSLIFNQGKCKFRDRWVSFSFKTSFHQSLSKLVTNPILLHRNKYCYWKSTFHLWITLLMFSVLETLNNRMTTIFACFIFCNGWTSEFYYYLNVHLLNSIDYCLYFLQLDWPSLAT